MPVSSQVVWASGFLMMMFRPHLAGECFLEAVEFVRFKIERCDKVVVAPVESYIAAITHIPSFAFADVVLVCGGFLGKARPDLALVIGALSRATRC